jgi:threonine aldolase
VYFVFNGTAANSLALSSLCQSYHSVITHETSHIETDECGGPEFFSNGTKILLGGGELGQLRTADAKKLITKRDDIHYPRPKVISITQPTELGTVYPLDRIARLSGLAKEYGLKMHMDGARLAHAIAHLDTTPKELTWQQGVDVVSVGGTKCGGLGEAVVFFDRALSEEFAYRCKQSGQLASKMRFLAAPWIALLKDGLWLRYAEQANSCAKLLRAELEAVSEVEILYPTEANSVFANLPQHVHDGLKAKGWSYYVFIGGGARFMCSWLTTEEDVKDLLDDIKASL